MMAIRNPNEYNEAERKVLEPLYEVIDPELFINIVDLGLIYIITLDYNKNIFISMTLFTRFCPMGESNTGGVHNAIHRVFPDHEIHIDLTYDPPWSFERLTPEGQKLLGM